LCRPWNWSFNKIDDRASLINLGAEVFTIFALKRDLRDIEHKFFQLIEGYIVVN